MSKSPEEIAAKKARAELKTQLLNTVKSGDVVTLRQLAKSPSERSPSANEDLNIALQKAAEAGVEKSVQALLELRADPNFIKNRLLVKNQELPSLYRAIKRGHEGIVKLLLQHGASLEPIGPQNQNPIMFAAPRGQNEILTLLLKHGANVNAKDKEGRSILHILAAEERKYDKKITFADTELNEVKGKKINDKGEILNSKGEAIGKVNTKGEILHGNNAVIGKVEHVEKAFPWEFDTVNILLRHRIDLTITDKSGRTALQWAAAMGNTRLAGLLLDHQGPRPSETSSNVDRGRTLLHLAAENGRLDMVLFLLTRGEEIHTGTERGRTALHFAAENGHTEIVRVLLDKDADKEVKSDGNWTPLLNAARGGHHDTVDFLLRCGAKVNARTSSGMTALHWAAENGNVKVVERILKEKDVLANSKDGFDNTPLARASQQRHQKLLDGQKHDNYQRILEMLRPHIFGGSLSRDAERACKKFNAAVMDFYNDDNVKEKDVIHTRSVYDVLYGLDKNDPKKFATTTAIEELRPRTPEFRWIHLPANNVAWVEALITKEHLEKGANNVATFKAMLRVLSQQQHRGPKAHSRFMRPFCQRIRTQAVHTTPVPRLKSPVIPGKSLAMRAESPTKPNQSRTSSTAGKAALSKPDEIVALFMPYLHWETDSYRSEMAKAIKRVETSRKERGVFPDISAVPQSDMAGPFNAPMAPPPRPVDSDINLPEKDILLIRSYLNSSTELHVRRTLDQFKHHSISTERRDRDQVVWRHCDREKKEHKIFMVDQLWMLILGNDLLVTSFPERCGQPKGDPLHLFRGVVEDLHSKNRPPVRSVYELAAVITERCTGTFDRHQWGNSDFLFLEMFELAIGALTNSETSLFKRFERYSTLAAKWLKYHDPSSPLYNAAKHEHYQAEDFDHGDEEEQSDDEEVDEEKRSTQFVNRLLNVAKEAKLLVECKDIQEELEILTSVLEQQMKILNDMHKVFRQCVVDEEKRGPLILKIDQQKELVRLHILDIQRMDKQASTVNANLLQVLDLKQKHANALEARFQRDQAQATARQAVITAQQGQILMSFTIVTIFFLPMSFMASFFAINVVEFPHDSSSGGSGLPLSYVSKYIFGIGFGISIPLIAVAFLFSDIKGWIKTLQAWLEKESPKHEKHPPTPANALADHSPTQIVDFAEKSRPSSDSFRPSVFTRHGTSRTDVTNRSRETDEEMGR